MNRRQFLGSAAAAGLALQQFPFGAFAAAADKAPRVGLIGTGWYGKMRPPSAHSGGAGRGRVAVRRGQEDARRRRRHRRRPPGVEEEAAHLRRLPRHAQGKRSRYRADRHAGPLARPADDRGRRVRGRRLLSEADQRGRRRGQGDVRRRPQEQARRPGRHPAPQHAAPHRGRDTIVKEGKLGKVGLVEIYCYYHMRATATRRTRSRRTTSTTKCGRGRRRCGRTTSGSIRAAGGPSWSTATASSATCASTCST